MQALRASAPRALSRWGAVLACALVVAGCGGSDDGDAGSTGPPASLPADFNIQVFACKDWQKADADVRRYAIGRIRDITGGEVSGTGGRGTVLSDEQAHRLFDNRCSDTAAGGFVLYKLYGHAAGFAGGAP